MTEQWTWKPEDDQENAILAAANYILRSGHPPVDRRICRRVPAQGAGVPYPIRSVLHAALIVYITECRELDDADGEMYARQAQQWLDSQPQAAPGGSSRRIAMDKILRVCIYPQCGWVGYTGDTCSLGQIDLLCPDCHGTTEELTPRWARELIALETSSAPGQEE